MSDNIRNSQGVDAILGDPKKALWKMSIPLIISLLITSLYSVIDAIWVSGLGADALAGFYYSNHFSNNNNFVTYFPKGYSTWNGCRKHN